MEVLDGGPLNGPHETLAQTLWHRASDGSDGGYAIHTDDGLDMMSWPEVRTEAARVASALHSAGIERGDRVAIVADTSRPWKIADHAIHAAGAVVVPVYPTLPPDVTQYILQDSGVKAIFVQDAAQHGKLGPHASLPTWSFEPVEGVTPMDDMAGGGLDVDASVAATTLDEPALLIYTSGTTGVPKGVLLDHRNVAGDAEAAVQGQDLETIDGPSLVAFLPLSHIAGYVSLAAMTRLGAKVLFSHPARMADDLQAFRPTIVLAVPRLWERIVRKVEEAVAEGSPLKQNLFARAKAVAMATGQAMEDKGRPGFWLRLRHGFYDRLIYSKLRRRLGFDRVCIGITGAAAVRPDLLWFLQGMGLPIIEGYGLTESSALTSGTRRHDWRGGTVGTPLPGCKVALGDKDEILIGGIGVFQEYWKLPDETAEARIMIDGEPWVRTGDVGRFDRGHLRIVDRLKEIEKLDTGKFVVPVRIEERLKSQTPLVEDSLVVAQDRKYASLLIQPAYDALLKWAEGHGIRPAEDAIIRNEAPTGEIQTYGIHDDAFLQHREVRAVFQQAIDDLNAQLADFEQVRRFLLLPDAFTVDRDELTPSFKKKRRRILENHRLLADSIYTE